MFVRTNPVGNGDQTGSKPKHGIFSGLIRQRPKLCNQLFRQLAPLILPRLLRQPSLKFSMMRAHYGRPTYADVGPRVFRGS